MSYSFKSISGNLLITAFLALALLVFFTPVSAIDYVEVNAGIDTIEWEGGHTEFEFFDIDNDGDVDILSIGDHGSPFINTQEHGVMTYFNNGANGWSLYQSGNFGYGGIAVGDVNNDGFADVGYGMHHDYSTTDFGDQLMEVALGDGTGMNWMPWDDRLASQGEDYGMFASDFADFDNDGDLDFTSSSFGFGNPQQVYRNRLDGSWDYITSLSTGNCSMSVQTGDINGDGNIDLVTSYQGTMAWLGTGTGYFINIDQGLPDGYFNGISLGDVDNDGRMEVSFYNGGIKVYKWNTMVNSWQDMSSGLPAGGNFYFSELCDMNQDGFCDLVAGGTGQVKVWTGNGQGQWTEETSYIIQNDPDAAFETLRAGGDIDHNGYPDIVHLTDEGGIFTSTNHIRLYRESSSPDSLLIRPVFPNGNEIFLARQVQFIEWISEVPWGQTATVNLEYSVSGQGGPWEVIASNIPNSGKYQWQVPQNVNSGNCYIRLTVNTLTGTAQAVTETPFMMYEPWELVELDLQPLGTPITIPPAGGSFDFDISFLCPTDIGAGFDAWINVILPNGTTINALLLRYGILMHGGQSIERTMSQFVPPNAPPGQYTYWTYIGVFDNGEVWDDVFFFFDKDSGAVDYSGSLNWTLSGWGEEETFSMESPALPEEFVLLNIYPNPFNAQTVISFDLPVSGEVSLKVFDITGREVATLGTGHWASGKHSVVWDAEGMASGVYNIKLSADGSRQSVKKVVLLK